MHFEFDLSWFLVWLSLPFATYLICRFLIANAERFGMLDLPSSRSSHSVPIPRLGGVGFVPVFGIYAVWVLFQTPNYNIDMPIGILLAMGVLFVVGALDDYRDLSAKIRLLVQFVLVLASLWVLFPALSAQGFKIWPLFAVLLAIAAVWWVNLFNFMDGADGFAGSQALIIAGAGALAVGCVGDYSAGSTAVGADFHLGFLKTYVALSWGLFLTLLGFLVLNWSPARVFMGDSGSTALAYYLFFSSLLVCLNDWRFTGYFLCLSAYFVSDATVTLLARIARRADVFKPHREHAYQLLLIQAAGNHARLTLYLLGWNAVVLFPFALWSLNESLQVSPLGHGADYWPIVLPVLAAYGASVSCVLYVRLRMVNAN